MSVYKWKLGKILPDDEIHMVVVAFKQGQLLKDWKIKV